MTPAKEILKMASEFGVCSRLQGTESPEQLMQLIFTPQGVEFCTKYNFPALSVFRTYKGTTAQRHHIYIDATVQLKNVERVLLVGDTQATLTYDDPTKGYEVIVMHGAKASITASNWTVVQVVNHSDCEVTVSLKDRARLL